MFGWDHTLGRCEHWCDAPCTTLKQPIRDCAGCIGPGYRCQLATLPNATFATRRGWTPGHCSNMAGRLGTRHGVEGDCDSGYFGSWGNRSELRDRVNSDERSFRQWCLALCEGERAPYAETRASLAYTIFCHRLYRMHSLPSFHALPMVALPPLRNPSAP